MTNFRVVEQPDPQIDKLGRSLGDYNYAVVGPADRQVIAVIAEDTDGTLIAGLSGYTAWLWLYTQWLWVAPDFRGQGLASQLMARAEEAAKSRGCIGAHIDTFSPQALKLYKALDYEVFGDIPDFVAGQTRSFLFKRWG